jgi:hypothetical protein
MSQEWVSTMASRLLLLSIIALVICSGCARVVVKRNPKPCDEGLRFYRPKPYLVVSQVEGGITMEIKYLPDFAEEYSIRMTPGINATTTFNPKLTDGWNLTGFESTADQNVDDLIKAVGGAIPMLAKSGDSDQGVMPNATIPLGFYEAVLDYDDRGCRKLAGWRYVGFFPYASTTASGPMSIPNSGAPDALWQLIWTGEKFDFVQQK